MPESREAMVAELKRTVVPVLRELGFRGTFPHFRREEDSRVDLLTFQFSMAGGQFVVEVGKFPSAGYELYGEVIPAAEVRGRHLLRRLRLGARSEAGDHWFNFERGDCAKVAQSVARLVRGQGAEWWGRA